jgi:hypothetical protein
MRRSISRVLLEATQTKLVEWTEKIKGAVKEKGIDLKTYEEKKRELIPQLKEAHDKGVPIRELSRITGICNATLCRWIKELEEKEQAPHAESRPP